LKQKAHLLHKFHLKLMHKRLKSADIGKAAG